MEPCELVLRAFSAYIKNESLCDVNGISDRFFMQFFRRAILHKVLPMAGSAMLCTPGALTDNQRNLLKKTVQQQMIGQTVRTHRFLVAYKAMTDAGAKPLCVKGIICRELYREPDMRLSGDEDLLVTETDFDVCAKKLRELGFEADKDDSEFEVGFLHRQSGCRIELHKRLFDPDNSISGCFNTFFEDIFATAHTLRIEDTDIYTPDDDLHFLYLVLHAFKHFIHAGIGIRQFCDIAMFAKYRKPDLDFTFEKCAQVNADVFLNAVLLIGDRYFGLDLDTLSAYCSHIDFRLDPVPLLDDVMSGGVYGADSMERHHSGTITFNSVEAAKKGKKSSFLRSVFPKKDKLKNKYTYLEDHPVLLPVAWGQRIIEYSKTKNDSSAIIEIGSKRVELLKKYRVIR